jgi:PIF1-like helicase
MHCSNATLHCTHILGSRELDLAYHWDDSWLGFSFDYLLSWLSHTKDITPPPSYAATPVDITLLSRQQLQDLCIISDHTFGATQQHHLLMIIVGTAGTGKSYLINAIRFLFAIHDESDAIRVTAPTGIAAANIHSSTIHSLLSLLNENLSGARLHSLQTALQSVRLLIIDEYSFLSTAMFDALDRQLRKIFPANTDCPFGALNIVLCGDPAQLAPVRGRPVYAITTNNHSPSSFHLFDTVIKLDQPFQQTGNDETQTRFRELLSHIANCDADTLQHWLYMYSDRSREPERRRQSGADANDRESQRNSTPKPDPGRNTRNAPNKAPP